MKNSTWWFGIWLSFLFLNIFVSNGASHTIKNYTVPVGPYLIYDWIDGSSTIVGDGKTQLYLKSDDGNFTIYDQDGVYVASGQPREMKPGDKKQSFSTDFKLQSGKKYTLSDDSVDIYTLAPTSINFESPRYSFNFVTAVVTVLLFSSFLVWVISL